MKKIILFISLLFFSLSSVYADEIKSIKMDIYVDNNGDAHITEVWDVNVSSGTEGYKPYYNIGKSTIKDFTVFSNYGNYSFISVWNTSSSFSSKSYKNGFNYIDNGIELCWGISKYGNNTYTLKYTITDFVLETSDSDVVYWTLIPHDLSSKPNYTYIKLYSDFKYSDNLDVWGYGNHGGYAYVYDGYIEATKETTLESDEYMTILIKYPMDSFNNPDNTSLNNFDYYLEMAKEGSTKNNSSFLTFILTRLVSTIVTLLPFVSVMIIFIVAIKKNQIYKAGNKKLNKDVPFFRDIPCKKDIYRAYYTSYCFSLIRKKEDFLGAILLNWLKKGQITINTEKDGKIIKKEHNSIVFGKVIAENHLEQRIFDMMYEASIDGVLEENEFKNWCSKHYTKILAWFDEVLHYKFDDLVDDKSIVEENKKVMGLFNKKTIDVSDHFVREAEELYGLKKYLIEFSNMKDKGAMEVKLWNEYLIYAQIFGIAKKVAEQFKKLYPEVITDYSYDSVVFIHSISYSGIQSASSARSRAQSYKSGGGGSFSSGGGGGSFGGGGGGGGFR